MTETPYWQTLRQRRIAAGFGLRHFAEAAGILPSDYCRMENGQQYISAAMQARIEYYLKEDPNDSWPPKTP